MAKKYDEVLASLEKQQVELNLKLVRINDNQRLDEIKNVKNLLRNL